VRPPWRVPGDVMITAQKGLRAWPAAISWAGLFLVVGGCATRPANGPAQHERVGSRYMVAADHPLASEIGADILRRGGNAVDAAVATSLALAVTRPYSTGLGGGGFMMIKWRGAQPIVLDYRETAPQACTADSYGDDSPAGPARSTRQGYWSVGVPGQMRGLQAALEKYGSLPFSELAEPAIRLAEKGFAVDANTHHAMQSLTNRLARIPDGWQRFHALAAIYLKGRRPYAIGETLTQPDLARTLRHLAERGPQDFYAGNLASRLETDSIAHRGPIGLRDLGAYAVQTREPLSGRIGPYRVVSMPPPSSGGACLLQVLGILDAMRAATLAPGDYYHVLAEALKFAFAQRATDLGDADGRPQIARAAARMISPEQVQRLQSRIAQHKTAAGPTAYRGDAPSANGGTTHFCVVDSEGNAVAATETINWYFGSLIVVPGTGMVLNNEMADFVAPQTVTNAYGMAIGDQNRLAPGRRPLSSMSPTMVLNGDDVVCVAGASGGTRIISSTLQVLFDILLRDQRAVDAVVRPRLHQQWIPNAIFVEKEFPAAVRDDLLRRGHVVRELKGHAGVCQVIYVHNNRVEGVSDPRKGGRPAGR